ncbi:MAG: hypothetical protein FWE90_03675 [Defluviitaleaceae bacterium]|nr:hypothetical protein [Defluviitaleaceae bacterium]
MERAPYRRYRGQPQRYEEESGALGETLILQGIISGIVLVAVMLVSIITFAPVTPIQNALREALSGPITVGEMADDARQFGIETLGFQWLDR